MANDIEVVEFNLLGGDVVQINLRARRASVLGDRVKISLNSQVALRN